MHHGALAIVQGESFVITKNIGNSFKKPWYIWLSFPGFMFLWGRTALLFHNTRYLNPFKFTEDYNFNLWIRACGNMFKLSFMVILPMIGLTFLVERLNESNHILGTIINVVQLVILYFLGVYAAYKHYLWRLENLPLFKPVIDKKDNDKT